MRVGIHPGASVLPGTESALVRCADGEVDAVLRAWNRSLVARELAMPLRTWRAAGGETWLHARCHPYLDASWLEACLLRAGGRRRMPRALVRELDALAVNCAAYAATGALRVDAALARGWPAWPLSLGRVPAILFGVGVRHRMVPMNLAPATSPVLVLAGGDKDVGRGLLRACGLPVPEGDRVESVAAALRVAAALAGPVVVKHLRGANSRGVRVYVEGEREVRRAARELLAGHRAILVERFVPGVELRVHFVAGRIRQTLVRGRANSGDEARMPGAFTAMHGGQRRTGPLHPDDVALLERFLSTHGGPSGAFDIVIPAPGRRIAEGGAVLEVNVPSGDWYLAEREAVAIAELDAWLASDAQFVEGAGRVPLWLLPVPALDDAAVLRIAAAFGRAYPHGARCRVTCDGGWAPVLTNPAPALLVTIDEPAVLRHGVPMHLQPRVWRSGSLEALAMANPVLAAVLRHCGTGVRFGSAA